MFLLDPSIGLSRLGGKRTPASTHVSLSSVVWRCNGTSADALSGGVAHPGQDQPWANKVEIRVCGRVIMGTRGRIVFLLCLAASFRSSRHTGHFGFELIRSYTSTTKPLLCPIQLIVLVAIILVSRYVSDEISPCYIVFEIIHRLRNHLPPMLSVLPLSKTTTFKSGAAEAAPRTSLLIPISFPHVAGDLYNTLFPRLPSTSTPSIPPLYSLNSSNHAIL